MSDDTARSRQAETRGRPQPANSVLRSKLVRYTRWQSVTGMTDSSGYQLPETVFKRFRVTKAVREPIAVEQWEIVPPEINSRQPLVLRFPRPLDWALLSHTITIAPLK